MNLTEIKKIDKIEILENGILQVREMCLIMRGDQEIAKNFHRWTFVPGTDISFMPENVQSVARSVWTPEVILSHKQQEAKRIKLGQ